MEKILAYVDHLNYRMMIVNDNLETMKKHKMNMRICQSDDEGDYQNEPLVSRKIFTSQKNLRGNPKKLDINLAED